jgi:guanylate kinase
MSNEARPERRGLLLVISSPSGAGKSSLSRALIAAHPDLAMSISATTRSPRPGELDGREYHFVSHQAFQRLIDEDAFLEWAEVHEHHYGTPRAPIMQALAEGRDTLFDIDWQGAEAIAKKAAVDTVRIFILPPSMAELAARLHSRAQDSQAVISRRLGRAKGEIAKWSDCEYVILNDDFERAYSELDAIYRAERLRRFRNLWLTPVVASLMAEPI